MERKKEKQPKQNRKGSRAESRVDRLGSVQPLPLSTSGFKMTKRPEPRGQTLTPTHPYILRREAREAHRHTSMLGKVTCRYRCAPSGTQAPQVSCIPYLKRYLSIGR